MKKLSAFFTALLMLFFLTACEGSSTRNVETSTSAPAASTTQSGSKTDTPAETADNAMQETEKSKILIVYFSRWGNTDYPSDVDATTSASIVADDERYGTTEYVARMIQNEVGGDIHLIETTAKYTANFDELKDVNHSEMADGFLPELKESGLDVSKYDTVFVGYPIWATDVPRAVISFLNKYDFSDKTVIPFCTHDGYGAGKSLGTIASESKAKNTADGLAIEAKDVLDSRKTVTGWLYSIGITKAQDGNTETSETAIKVTIGETVLDGVIYDTALAKEIMEYFPLTVSMVGYIGREYYGSVDFYPENLEGGQRNFENGDITYCEPHHNMAIFYAQTDKPTLSVDVIPIGRITSDLSVFESFDSTETVTFSLAE